MRRCLVLVLLLLPLSAARADALTVRDVIELSKARVSDQVLLALIEVDRSVFTMDAATVKQLTDAGVSEPVILALIRSGRSEAPAAAQPATAPEAAPSSDDPAAAPQAQVVVIDHHDAAAPAPVYVPVAVPMYFPVQPFGTFRPERVTHDVVTDGGGLVRVRETLPPNCTQAQPVFWGNGGKQRRGTFAPPVEIVCR